MKKSTEPSAVDPPKTRTSHPITVATVLPARDGVPARLTEALDSDERTALQAVQYAARPR
jgi:hypothetical protein